MNDFKVGDRVEYFGPMQEKRGKTYTIKGFMSGTADVDEDPSFGPLLHNLRLITRTPDVITIDRADLPEVVVAPVGHYLIAGDQRGKHATAEGCRESALISLALAEFLEAREKAAEEAAAEKEAAAKLAKRRDELAVTYFEGAYSHLPRISYRRAIDRIIELEYARG